MINICTLGSVADGKSSMIKMLTGEKTQRDSRELKRNITINAGYSNLKIWKCLNCEIKYSSNEEKNEYQCCCNNICKLIKHISFADCPGHQELITTMLSSVSITQGCIIVCSVEIPLKEKPQLKQHLLAAKFANFKNIIICLNKCDLQIKSVVMDRYNELINLLNELDIKYSIIIPTSFTNNCGLNELIESIDKYFNIIDNIEEKTLFRITRTFDINKPGTLYNLVKGGCLGGTLMSGGELNINDEVEIRPGIIDIKKKTHKPIITKLISFQTNNCEIEKIRPGGLVSINTNIDPYYCKNNKMLCGQLLGKVGELPKVYTTIKINFTKIDNIWQPKNGDQIYLQITNMSVEGRLTKFKNNTFTFDLLKPVCIENNCQILICRKQPVITIVGYGTMI
jgi:translation initiation factor 2 subunit 3